MRGVCVSVFVLWNSALFERTIALHTSLVGMYTWEKSVRLNTARKSLCVFLKNSHETGLSNSGGMNTSLHDTTFDTNVFWKLNSLALIYC